MQAPTARFAAKMLSRALPLAALLLLPFSASAGISASSVVGLFPKQVTAFAYADMKIVAKYPWFAQLEDQLLPGNFKGFQQFVTVMAVDPNSQVDALYWGQVMTPGAGEQAVGVALGHFDLMALDDRLKSERMAFVESRGYKFYAYGNGDSPGDLFFVFFDSGLAAFGQRAAIEQLLDVRAGATESFFQNTTLFPLVNSAAGNDTLWAALDAGAAREALHTFAPEASQFPQIAAIRDRLSALIIRLQVDDPGTNIPPPDDTAIAVSFEMVCGSPDDANLLAAALQVALMLRNSQRSADPQFAGIFDHAKVTPSGDRLDLQFSLTQEQLISLALASAPRP